MHEPVQTHTYVIVELCTVFPTVIGVSRLPRLFYQVNSTLVLVINCLVDISVRFSSVIVLRLNNFIDILTLMLIITRLVNCKFKHASKLFRKEQASSRPHRQG